jgi:hypothetical protein
MPSDNMKPSSRLFIIVLIGLLNCKSSEESDARIVKSEMFGVEAIDNSSDSEQIRIWYLHSFLHFVYVVSIKKTSEQWSATLTTSIRDIEIDSFVVREVNTRVLIPKSGWKIFMDDLTALDIRELPDMEDIPEFTDGLLDGSQYLIEIARKNYYRSYGYHGPDHFEKEFTEAKKMTDILRLVDHELGIPWKTGNWSWYEFIEKELK